MAEHQGDRGWAAGPQEIGHCCSLGKYNSTRTYVHTYTQPMTHLPFYGLAKSDVHTLLKGSLSEVRTES